MTSHTRLYARPDPLVCTLAISGVLVGFRRGVQYQGTLSYTGAHGAVSVESWEGLPPGGEVSLDALNGQVVVTWPTAEIKPPQPVTIDAGNMDFEDGAVGWDLGAGTSIVQGGPPFPPPWDSGSTWSAQYLDESGDSEIVNQTFVPITNAATEVNANCSVYQGRSSKRHAAGAVRIKWYDKDKNFISQDTGGWVTSNTDWKGDPEWHGSYVTALPPAGALYKKLAGVFTRSRENKALWIDTFGWDGAYTYFADESKIGYDSEDAIHLTIVIRDAAGCRASWSGVILEYARYETSQLYPLFTQDDADSPVLTGGSTDLFNPLLAPSIAEESLLTGGQTDQFNMVTTVSYSTHNQPQDDTDSPTLAGGSTDTFTMTVVAGYLTQVWGQDDTDSPTLAGGQTDQFTMTTV